MLRHLLFLLTPTLLFASYEPNFGGTLLSFFPENIAPGEYFIEPYLFIQSSNKTYKSNWHTTHKPHTLQNTLLTIFETGITPWLDISLYTTENYNIIHHHKTFLYGDTRLALGFQLTKNDLHGATPDLRLLLLESFPTGSFQNLSPHKHQTDVSGSGSFETWLILVTHKIIYLTPRNPITINLTLQYDFPSPVHAHKLSIYSPTTAHVHPGNQLIANLGLEYPLTLTWILGLDIHYHHQNRSRSTAPSTERYSLAPCIEYAPSLNFGFEFGTWFTIAGRNTTSYITPVATVYWLF